MRFPLLIGIVILSVFIVTELKKERIRKIKSSLKFLSKFPV